MENTHDTVSAIHASLQPERFVEPRNPNVRLLVVDKVAEEDGKKAADNAKDEEIPDDHREDPVGVADQAAINVTCRITQTAWRLATSA